MLLERRKQFIESFNREVGSPKDQVVCFRTLRQAAAAGRSDIFQKLDARPSFSPQSSDSHTGAKDLVKVLLLHAVVFTFTRHAHSKQVAIELQARFCVRDHEGGVINSQEKFSSFFLPFGITFASREPNDLQHMVFRIPKIKCLDPCCARVPFRQGLRRRGHVFNPSLAQVIKSLIHVPNDDGQMLKPMVKTARIEWYWTSFDPVLRQRNSFTPEF